MSDQGLARSAPAAMPETRPSFTDLPTEIIQHIFTFCPLTTLYAIRHTNRTMYSLTKLSDGTTNLLDMSPSQCTKYERGIALANIEAAWPHSNAPLHGLTCSNCARIKYNDVKGFADDEYVQTNAYRMCIKCKMQEYALLQIRQKSFTVREVLMFACNSCGLAKKIEEEAGGGMNHRIFPTTWMQLQRVTGGACGNHRRRCRRCFLKVSLGHDLTAWMARVCLPGTCSNALLMLCRQALWMRKVSILANMKASCAAGKIHGKDLTTNFEREML